MAMPDEINLISLIAERLEKGRESYGALNLATDERDFTAEALEELLDGAIYLASKLMKLRRAEMKTKGRKK